MEAMDYTARRQRLGYAITPPPRVRLDLIGRAPPRMVVKLAPVAPPPVEKLVEPTPMPTSPVTSGTPFNFLKEPNWRAIVKLVALKHGVDTADILGPCRIVKFVHARQEAMYLVYSHCDFSMLDIAYRFRRDHTTVLHSVRKMKRMRLARGTARC